MVTVPYRNTITAIVIRCSFIISLALICLIVIFNYISEVIFDIRIIFGLTIILFILVAELSTRKGNYVVAGWMVMLLYSSLASAILLLCGLNTTVGILVAGFVVFLSGVMLGPKHILSVIVPLVIILIVIQHIHSSGYINPSIEIFTKPSQYQDVLVYTTILGIFALISWLSGKQTEDSLERAMAAEEKVRIEKENLEEKLKEQSAQLREAQLLEMVGLYKFAAIGQSTTATLHELSNLLSVLTLDIDDIGQQHQRSEAIVSTKKDIQQINHLVNQARRQLHDNRNMEVFNIIPVIEQTLKELQPKFSFKAVELQKQIPQRKSFRIIGDALNLSHVLNILINNSLDACTSVPNPKVTIRLQQANNYLKIVIIDNGIGIPKSERASVFTPHQSSKPFGLGIGLYITRHIIENQLNGKISFSSSASETKFSIELPRYSKSKIANKS